MKKEFIILGFIFILGVLLRFFNLEEIPFGFHRDEAFLGYNAYSILKTGRDMSGNFLPLHFESFIFSPGGYSYFSIPFILSFGLSEFSARFASAFFGSLSIILIYWFVKLLFDSFVNKKYIALFAAFLFSISPWSIILSRTATENVLVTFFILLGSTLFIKWTKKPSRILLIASFISFALTLFIYQAPRAFLPFYIPLMFFVLYRFKNIKQLLFPVVLFVLFIILPIILVITSPELSLRIRTVSVFASNGVPLRIDEQIREEGVQGIPAYQTRIFHNKVIGFGKEFLSNYFSHFSYSFLFSDSGVPDRYRVPMGFLLYLVELPLFFLGVFFLLQKNLKRAVFLLGWVLLVPIGSGLTFDDVPNLQRTFIMLPPILIFISYSFNEVFLKIHNRKIAYLFLFSVFFLIFFQFLYFVRQYYIHYSVYRPWYRQDGYKQLVSEVNNLLPHYKKAIITNRESAPTVFFLFYSKYNPTSFQNQARISKLRDFDRISFANYEFSQEECPVREVIDKDGNKNITGDKDVLYVNSGLCKNPEEIKVLGEIKRKDGSRAFYIIENSF